MIGGFGIGELVIILLIVLLIFGPSKLGDIGSSLGKGISGFKKAMQDKGSKEEKSSGEADENDDSKKTD
jgi:sec-independent protein translocase protein TatA